mmetsp:Transcript_51972/g.149045  ORF Transcript_51972/g.149045 Transcript_51972/m.149045 type:complete len:432 (-) Transcript_51972:5-1300(-)
MTLEQRRRSILGRETRQQDGADNAAEHNRQDDRRHPPPGRRPLQRALQVELGGQGQLGEDAEVHCRGRHLEDVAVQVALQLGHRRIPRLEAGAPEDRGLEELAVRSREVLLESPQTAQGPCLLFGRAEPQAELDHGVRRENVAGEARAQREITSTKLKELGAPESHSTVAPATDQGLPHRSGELRMKDSSQDNVFVFQILSLHLPEEVIEDLGHARETGPTALPGAVRRPRHGSVRRQLRPQILRPDLLPSRRWIFGLEPDDEPAALGVEALHHSAQTVERHAGLTLQPGDDRRLARHRQAVRLLESPHRAGQCQEGADIGRASISREWLVRPRAMQQTQYADHGLACLCGKACTHAIAQLTVRCRMPAGDRDAQQMQNMAFLDVIHRLQCDEERERLQVWPHDILCCRPLHRRRTPRPRSIHFPHPATTN